MATAVTTLNIYTFSGRQHYVITCTEADAAAGSEWSVAGLPAVGTIVAYKATLVTATSTGTTIQPKVGAASGWAADTQDAIASQAAAAVHIDDQTKVYYTNPQGAGPLYFVSVVDAGSDNDILTELVIIEGHQT